MRIPWISVTAIALMLITATSCKTAKPSATNLILTKAALPANNSVADKNYILGFTMRVYRTKGDSNIHFDALGWIKAEGKLKPKQSDNGKDFIALFVDDNNNVLATSMLMNPLDVLMESPGEGNGLVSVKVKKDEGYVSVRVNYNAAMKKIIIRKSDAADTSTLAIIPIQAS